MKYIKSNIQEIYPHFISTYLNGREVVILFKNKKTLKKWEYNFMEATNKTRFKLEMMQNNPYFAFDKNGTLESIWLILEQPIKFQEAVPFIEVQCYDINLILMLETELEYVLFKKKIKKSNPIFIHVNSDIKLNRIQGNEAIIHATIDQICAEDFKSKEGFTKMVV